MGSGRPIAFDAFLPCQEGRKADEPSAQVRLITEIVRVIVPVPANMIGRLLDDGDLQFVALYSKGPAHATPRRGIN
jgi:hypothetical protein